MRRPALHILLAILAASLLLGACSRGRVIPRSKMVDIYADMFMADQWLKGDYKYRRMADTTLLYEPILESYGYTTDDYLKSVRKYMKDPDRFSRILKRTAAKLEKEASKLSLEIDKVRFSQTSRSEIEAWMREVIACKALDSLVFSSFVKTPSDTSWEGVRMVIDSSWRVKADSLAVADSLARVDSLARIDSLARVDSLAKVDTPARSDSSAKVIHGKMEKQVSGKNLRELLDSSRAKKRNLQEAPRAVKSADLGDI